MIHKNTPISMQILYKDIDFTVTSDLIPVNSINSPITKERIVEQINKLGGTCFEFENIEVDLDDNLYIPSISKLNQLRRDCISKLEEILLDRIHRNSELVSFKNDNILDNTANQKNAKKGISILLNTLNENFDYTNLKNIDKLYIPLKYFYMPNFEKTIINISNLFNTYIYMPSILKGNVATKVSENMQNITSKFSIKGFVISNISHIKMLEKFSNYKFIANYNMNVYNDYTADELNNFNISVITISPELDKNTINEISSKSKTEAIIYGNTPVMTINYCLLSKSNSCLENCASNCSSSDSAGFCGTKYYLKDRMNMNFGIIPDSFSKTTTIYNSKKTSISALDLNVDFVRLDFMDEDVDEINLIVNKFRNGEILEGKDFTNGNFNRLV